jgi:hypothetical protein
MVASDIGSGKQHRFAAEMRSRFARFADGPKEHDAHRKALDRLLRDLRIGAAGSP